MKARPYLRSVSLKEKVHRGKYPFNIPVISKLGTIEFHESVTFFVGENGSGKSTLLEAIAVAMELGAEGGTRDTLFETAPTISNLHENLKLVKSFIAPKDRFFLRAESFYNLATYLDGINSDLQSYGGSSLHECSHGEAFLRLMLHKFRGKGLYLLDEPEAALSPSRQLAALIRMHDLVAEESQFIIATHSPILMAYPESKIYHFDEAGHHEIKYQETEHYRVTKDFLNNFPKRLETMFE